MSLDDSMHGRESEAAAALAMAVERLKDASLKLGRHPDAIIGDLADQEARTRRDRPKNQRAVGVDRLPRVHGGLNPDGPDLPRPQRLGGVLHRVQDQLVELPLVPEQAGTLWTERERDLTTILDDHPQKFLHLHDDRVELEGLTTQ